MITLARVKPDFLHSQLGFPTESFSEMALRELAERHPLSLRYEPMQGTLSALNLPDADIIIEVQELKGRTIQ